MRRSYQARGKINDHLYQYHFV
jgi:hypothetical protein